MTDATNRLCCKVGLRRQGKHKKIQAQQDRQDSTEGGEERRSQTLLFPNRNTGTALGRYQWSLEGNEL